MNRAIRSLGWCSALALMLLVGASVMLAGAGPACAQSDAKYVGAAACQECHSEQADKFRASPHGRAAMDSAVVARTVGCESCHGPGSLHVAAAGNTSDPGFKTVNNFKAMKGDKASAVCVTCHTGGDHFFWKQSAHSRNDVSCVNCHSVHHAADAKKPGLLAAKDVNSLCLKCHTDKRAQMARSAHMPLREGGMTCVDCHSPHGSAAPKQLRAASGNDLCLSCHADKRGPMLWEHAPVRENCMTCHEPHGSNNPRMLVSRTPFLCQRCHEGHRHPSTLYDQPDLTVRDARMVNRGCVNCHAMIHGSNHPSGKTFLR